MTQSALRELSRVLQGKTASIADWPAVLELANRHLLSPSLWSAFAAAGNAGLLPAEVRDYLQGLHALNGKRNTVILRQVQEVAGALNQAGIVPVLLKGALTLFDGPYEDPATRMMHDIDLLVPASQRSATIGALEGLGYRLTRAYGETHHAFGDFARHGDPAAIDLHTELIDPHYMLPAAEVRQRGTFRRLNGIALITPSPTDRVLHNILHAEIHHLGHYYRGDLQIAQLYELTVLARSFAAAIDWQFVEHQLEMFRLATCLRAYLIAAERLFGFGWPLSGRRGMPGRLHYIRCNLQERSSLAKQAGVAWGNIWGPMAWHRMKALYGTSGNGLTWRCRHLAQYLRKKGARSGIARLRRAN